MSKGLTIIVLVLLSLIDAITLAISQIEGPFPSIVPLGNPTAYRSLYIHVPISITTYLLFTLGFLFAIVYLLKRESRFEIAAHSFILAGILMGFSTLVTGIIWASESWGSSWNWDPRETGVLFMFLAFLVYLAIRSSIKDPNVRPRVSMAFAVAAYATIPLSFLAPYLMPSLHPTASETEMFMGGGILELFITRVFIVAIESIFLSYFTISRRDKRIISAIIPTLLVAMILVAVQLPPNLASDHPNGTFKVQVLRGSIENDFLKLNVRTTYKQDYILLYHGKPPINPLFVTMNGKENGKRRFTLEKHWLLVEGTTQDRVIKARSIKLISYWGNSVNALIYSLTLLSLAYFLGRERA